MSDDGVISPPPLPPEPRCRACRGTGVVHDTRRDVLVRCPACQTTEEPMAEISDPGIIEARNLGHTVTSLASERDGKHVLLHVRVHGITAGTLLFEKATERDDFVWVVHRLAGDGGVVCEQGLPFNADQMEELFR